MARRSRQAFAHRRWDDQRLQDALQDVEDFKLPEGELTKEILITKGDAFNTLYHKQPKERWGIKSDVFKAWAAKLYRTIRLRACSLRSTRLT